VNAKDIKEVPTEKILNNLRSPDGPGIGGKMEKIFSWTRKEAAD